MIGHCSKCGKVWTLETRQGLCQWCERPAVCQTTRTQPRHIKSRSNGKKRQAETYNKGYDQLDGEWLTYYKVASQFNHKAKAQDRDDLLDDIMIALADVASNNGHKPLTEPAMYRIASVTVVHYWRAQYKHANGLDCHNCSKAQRQKCRAEDLYSECPKAIKLVYLSQPVTDSKGNLTELGELIADDKAIDLDQWLDDKTWRLGCKTRLIEIATKKVNGQPLNWSDYKYWERELKKSQKPYSDVQF